MVRDEVPSFCECYDAKAYEATNLVVDYAELLAGRFKRGAAEERRIAENGW